MNTTFSATKMLVGATRRMINFRWITRTTIGLRKVNVQERYQRLRSIPGIDLELLEKNEMGLEKLPELHLSEYTERLMRKLFAELRDEGLKQLDEGVPHEEIQEELGLDKNGMAVLLDLHKRRNSASGGE